MEATFLYHSLTNETKLAFAAHRPSYIQNRRLEPNRGTEDLQHAWRAVEFDEGKCRVSTIPISRTHACEKLGVVFYS